MARIILISLLLVQFLPAQSSDLPSVTHYKLDVQFHLREQRVNVVAALSVRNTTKEPFTELPFLLYRLLTIQHTSTQSGAPLTFKQTVAAFDDVPSLQANAVTVRLASPLQPDDSVTVIMTYSGFIFGYPEVMAYVRDRIDEQYALLRPDAFAYPMLAEPAFASVLAASDTKFTYEVIASVPKAYRVACGGELISSQTNAESATFTFRSRIPTWRIDIAAAPFAILKNSDNHLTVYHLPNDSAGARRVLDASRDVVSLYGRWFGIPTTYKGYTIIQIPDGWGSQASDYYFLQSAAAFRDSGRISEVYHEIAHSWNATPSSEIQRCRYFDEAFASFFEALAIRSFDGEPAFENHMEQSRSQFVRRALSDRQVFDTPIADYGKYKLGRHSYTKGAWSLYVLFRLVGDEVFSAIIRTLLTEFEGRTVNFTDFQKLAERVAQRDLQRFFQEWIHGTESSKLLADNLTVAEIVKRY